MFCTQIKINHQLINHQHDHNGHFHSHCLAARKYEATIASIKLDVGADCEMLHRYSYSVLSFCADFGTESLIAEDAWMR